MGNASEQARKSLREGRIPIGSALAREGELLAAITTNASKTTTQVAHAGIGCLRNAGRLGSFRDTVLFSTLISCYLCAGAVVQFGVRKVIVGDSRTFAGVADFMRNCGVDVNDLDLQECA